MLTDGQTTDGRTTDGRRTDGRTTDARVIGIRIAHLGAFGSGELIINDSLLMLPLMAIILELWPLITQLCFFNPFTDVYINTHYMPGENKAILMLLCCYI